MKNHKKIKFIDNLTFNKVRFRYGKNLNTFSSEGCIVSYERDNRVIIFNNGLVKGYQVWNLCFKGTNFQNVHRMIDTKFSRCNIDKSEIRECNFQECIVKNCYIKDSYIEVGNIFIKCYFENCWGPGLDQESNLIDCNFNNLIIH